MRKALMMTPIAVLMAAMPLSAGAADADTSAKAKIKTGVMDKTRSDLNYPRARIDDNNDGTVDAEGNIVAGIDHDRDPASPYLYAVDLDGDGVGDRWVSRAGGADYYTTYADYEMDPRTSNRSAWLDMDQDGVAETRADVVADYGMEGDVPMHYAVDVDGDGYADRWVYHNEGLQVEGSS